MARISDKERYPNQEDVKSSDYVIGSDGVTKATKTFTIGQIAALLSTVSPKEFSLSGVSFIQDDDFIDANGVYGMVSGQSFAVGDNNNSVGFIGSFNKSTGTINISTGFTPFTGLVTIFYW